MTRPFSRTLTPMVSFVHDPPLLLSYPVCFSLCADYCCRGDTLTQLLRATLKDWHGPLPRLAYITDKGSACDEYYQRVLKKMKHPRDGKPLVWEWVLDFWHVCSYLGKMADALFGAETKEGAKWFAKMRRWLRERPQGVANVLRSAMQHVDRRKMPKGQKAEFWKAYRYLRHHQIGRHTSELQSLR